MEVVCGITVAGCGPEDFMVWGGFILAVAVAWQLRKYAGPVVGAMEARVKQLEEQNKRQQQLLDVLREEVGAEKAIATLRAEVATHAAEVRADHASLIAGQTRALNVLAALTTTQEHTAELLRELLTRRREDRAT